MKNTYYYRDVSGNWIYILPNTVMRIWDLRSQSPANPNLLPDYWENVLVLIDDGANHPRLVWGPYPAYEFIVSYYKVYKKKGTANFLFYASVTGMEYSDSAEQLVSGPPIANETIAQYKVSAVGYFAGEAPFETGFTNIVEARVKGRAIAKVRDRGNKENTPGKFSLAQNYPNPFNPQTTILYFLKENARVQIRVYDNVGSLVRELVNEYQEAGRHRVGFDASSLASGIYYYTLSSGDFRQIRKMLLLK